MPRHIPLVALLLSMTSGCIIIDFGETSPYDTGDEPRDPIDGDTLGDAPSFQTWAYDLPDETFAAAGWTFDRTQRHVGGLVESPAGIQSATLSLSTPTGGVLDDLALSAPWPGALTAAPKRIWLDDQALDWAAWAGEDSDWLGLRGISELTVRDDVGARGVDAWVGDDELVLTACGDGGLRVWTTDLDGVIANTASIDTPGDRCAILAPYGEPMVLLGDASGGPLTRWLLEDGVLFDPLVINGQIFADQVATASATDMALFALADGEQIALISAWGDTRHVAPETDANWLVLDVLPDGRSAVAWVDAEGEIHAHWGGLDAPLPAVQFSIDTPPLGLAVGLRDEVISLATFDGTGVILARQLP